MKSLASCLLKVVEGIYQDYLSTYPTDKLDSDRDLSRLTQLVKSRGIGLFTLDLPNLDSILLDGLQTGRLSLDGALCKRASKRIHVPRLFRGIWLRVFDVSGSLKEEPDPTSVFFLRQLCCLGKKLELGCTHQRVRNTLDEYRAIESSIHRPTLRWADDCLGSDDAIGANHLCDASTRSIWSDEPLLWDERSCDSKFNRDRAHYLLRECQRNFDALAYAIGKFNVDEFYVALQLSAAGIGFKHGPGAVADLSKKEFKYDFPYWPAKLEAFFPFEQNGVTGITESQVETYGSDEGFRTPVFPHSGKVSSDVHQVDRTLFSLLENECENILDGGPLCSPDISGVQRRRPSISEPFSRLYAVPKTAKGPRLIAAEPTAHQWCQQFTLKFLSERMSGLFGDYFITLRDQEPSKRMARQASLDGTMATVDLSSASDRLSCWLVERAFRSNPSLLRALHSHRTRGLTIDDSEYFLLRKFATQGTAVTFPIQSLVFLVIALTASGFRARDPSDFCLRTSHRLYKLRNQVRVFGDDIIIPKDGYDDLCCLLTILGLKVNHGKSFSKGYFRESCGGDYFMGYDVTPVKTTSYSSAGPTSRQSLIDYSNNLFKKGLWHAAKTVESTIPGWVFRNLPVVSARGSGCGLVSFCGSSVVHLRKRWNERLHRHDVLSYTVMAVSKRKKTTSTNAVLQYFAENPSPNNHWEHGVASVPKTRDRLRWEFPFYAMGQ